jgi:glutaredoxin 3
MSESGNDRARAAAPAAGPRIEIYTGRHCGYCVRAKQLLKARGADFIEYDADIDLEARRAMTERAGGRRTLPQIFINGRGIGGFAELYRLDRSGELDELLQESTAASRDGDRSR